MPDPLDPERSRAETPFNRSDGYSGQDYRPEDETALGRRAVEPNAGADGRDLPRDNGRPAGADPRTGEVRGSGVGAGGGQPGEDFDTGSDAGDGYPLTGGEGGGSAPADLGPTRVSP